MDEAALRELYERTWRAMIAKDERELEVCHSEAFVLVHMTGLHQPKEDYVRSIVGGTLNYYSAETEAFDVVLADAEHAEVTGMSKVSAAVYGGGKHTWRLRMSFRAVREKGVWRFCHCEVTTY